jgi:hypothetical protein
MKKSPLNKISKKRLAIGKFVGLKRTPMKRRITPTISRETAKIIEERSNGSCEFRDCPNGPIESAHIKHRQMGGRHGDAQKIYDDQRNVARLCQLHHSICDNRIYKPEYRAEIRSFIKNKIGWYDWVREYSIPIGEKDEQE